MGTLIRVNELQPLDNLIKSLKTRSHNYHDTVLKDVNHLKIGVDKVGSKPTYTAEVEGKKLELLPSALGSLCKMFSMDWEYFSSFPRPEEFAEHVNTLMKLRKKDGVLVRAVGEKLRAILPSDFTILDDDNFFETFAERINTLPNLMGVKVDSDPRTGYAQYRMIFGDPIDKSDLKDTRVMLQFINSEIGAYPLRITGGTFTFTCSNGMIALDDDFGHWSWLHSGGKEKAFDKIRAAMGASKENLNSLILPVQNASKVKLETPMQELLKKLVEASEFPQKLSRRMVHFVNDKKLKPETELDLMQVMTDVAQSYPNGRRTLYEGKAFEITRRGWQRTLKDAIARSKPPRPITRN
jgi:hypothetical protein